MTAFLQRADDDDDDDDDEDDGNNEELNRIELIMLGTTKNNAITE